MAAPGGPDKETWDKMSPSDRRIYRVFVIVVFSLVGAAIFRALFW